MVAIGRGTKATVLRSTAVEVWDLLAEEPRSREALATVLGARHGLTVEQVAVDLESFIGDLMAVGLVVTVGEPEDGRAATP